MRKGPNGEAKSQDTSLNARVKETSIRSEAPLAQERLQKIRGPSPEAHNTRASGVRLDARQLHPQAAAMANLWLRQVPSMLTGSPL
jgi:hypothetical protein